jgi:hypothetical protein
MESFYEYEVTPTPRVLLDKWRRRDYRLIYSGVGRTGTKTSVVAVTHVSS